MLVAQGQVTIPTAGPWTFGTHGDDGFRLDVGDSFRLEFAAPRVAVDTFGVFEVPHAGDYELTFLYFHSTGHAETELFAAPGRHTSWNGNFRLVGDTVTGGLAVSTAEGAGSDIRPLIRRDVQIEVRITGRGLAAAGRFQSGCRPRHL